MATAVDLDALGLEFAREPLAGEAASMDAEAKAAEAMLRELLLLDGEIGGPSHEHPHEHSYEHSHEPTEAELMAAAAGLGLDDSLDDEAPQGPEAGLVMGLVGSEGDDLLPPGMDDVMVDDEAALLAELKSTTLQDTLAAFDAAEARTVLDTLSLPAVGIGSFTSLAAGSLPPGLGAPRPEDEKQVQIDALQFLGQLADDTGDLGLGKLGTLDLPALDLPALDLPALADLPVASFGGSFVISLAAASFPAAATDATTDAAVAALGLPELPPLGEEMLLPAEYPGLYPGLEAASLALPTMSLAGLSLPPVLSAAVGGMDGIDAFEDLGLLGDELANLALPAQAKVCLLAA